MKCKLESKAIGDGGFFFQGTVGSCSSLLARGITGSSARVVLTSGDVDRQEGGSWKDPTPRVNSSDV